MGGLRVCNCKLGKVLLYVVRAVYGIAGKRKSLGLMGRVLQSNRRLLREPVALLSNIRRIVSTLRRGCGLMLTAGNSLFSRGEGVSTSKLRRCFYRVRVVDSGGGTSCGELLSGLKYGTRGLLVVNGSVGSSVVPVLRLKNCTACMPRRIA